MTEKRRLKRRRQAGRPGPTVSIQLFGWPTDVCALLNACGFALGGGVLIVIADSIRLRGFRRDDGFGCGPTLCFWSFRSGFHNTHFHFVHTESYRLAGARNVDIDLSANDVWTRVLHNILAGIRSRVADLDDRAYWENVWIRCNRSSFLGDGLRSRFA